MSRPKRPSTDTIKSWQDRRFGMFIHWGLYSIPAGLWKGEQIGGYSEQIQAHARIPKEEYVKLAEQFNPTEWNPDAVVSLAKQAGMKFIVLTAKHHDGFSLFDTSASDYNVVRATPYGKDVVKELAEACAKAGLQFGVYFSTIDWHFEGANGVDYGDGPGVRNDNEIPEAHAQFNVVQLEELLTNYGPISEVWFDMGRPTPEQSALFADTVHRIQPECMVSGRVFNYQGDFTVMGDNEIPSHPIEEPWQCPASIFHETWGYRSWQDRGDLDAKVAEHVANYVRVVSQGGNYLLNIGPRGDGSIVEFEADVLRGIGSWLASNGEALERPQQEADSPTISPSSTGVIELMPDRADGLYHYNGLGYYDEPKLYKLRWHVQPQPGRYAVLASFVGSQAVRFQLRTGDQILLGTSSELVELGVVDFAEERVVEISISPVEPFEKGTPLGVQLNWLRLTHSNAD